MFEAETNLIQMSLSNTSGDRDTSLSAILMFQIKNTKTTIVLNMGIEDSYMLGADKPNLYCCTEKLILIADTSLEKLHAWG